VRQGALAETGSAYLQSSFKLTRTRKLGRKLYTGWRKGMAGILREADRRRVDFANGAVRRRKKSIKEGSGRFAACASVPAKSVIMSSRKAARAFFSGERHVTASAFPHIANDAAQGREVKCRRASCNWLTAYSSRVPAVVHGASLGHGQSRSPATRAHRNETRGLGPNTASETWPGAWA